MNRTFRLAQRLERIAPFHVMALLEQARNLEAAGHDVIHLEVGEPDFPAPDAVREAAVDALEKGLTHYTAATGLSTLREAISDYYRQHFHVTVPPEQIVITPGASGALQLALSALVNPGDSVLVTDPGYPCNRHFIELLNGVPRRIPLSVENGFRLTAEAIEQAWQADTVAAMLASPENPTGTVLSPALLHRVAQWVRAQDGCLIVDEIYQGLEYVEGARHSALQQDTDLVVLNSFSKYFGMTGFRLGWMVVPPPLVDPVTRMAQNFFLAPNTVAQHAALAVFQPATQVELERRRQVLNERRQRALVALENAGIKVAAEAQGAFYIYLDISEFGLPAMTFCQHLLAEHFVALTPGDDFGVSHQPGRFVRLAYTTEAARIEQAITRLAAFVATLPGKQVAASAETRQTPVPPRTPTRNDA